MILYITLICNVMESSCRYMSMFYRKLQRTYSEKTYNTVQVQLQCDMSVSSDYFTAKFMIKFESRTLKTRLSYIYSITNKCTKLIYYINYLITQ